MAGMYNPNSEATNEEQVIAAHWELLRRNKKFRSLSARWLKSEKFRRGFVLTSAYHDLQRHTPRCAWDWMLTSEERVRLANFQIANLKWVFDSRYNFGPLICPQEFSAIEVTRENFRQYFRPECLPNPPAPLRVDQCWREVPDLFKTQFRTAYNSGFEFGEIASSLASVAKFLRDAAVLLKRDALKNSVEVAKLLFNCGSELRDLAEFCKVYSIPRGCYSERQFKKFLERVRADFNATIPLTPTKKYDAHKSYYGTAEDWRWFLEAEWRGLDIRTSADLLALSKVYSEDLRGRVKRGNAPHRTNGYGFKGTSIRYKLVKNRRITVKRHIENIEKWIDDAYPPQAA